MSTRGRSGPEAPDRRGARQTEVARAHLVAELRALSDTPVVVVVGGAGFGKTTLVHQWLRDDPRPVAWLQLGHEHDDAALLLGAVVGLLDGIEPIEPRAKRRLDPTGIDFNAIVMPRLERAIAERERAFVLVLDDLHLLRHRDALAVVQAFTNRMPTGSQVVLVSRHEPRAGLDRLRTDRRVHTIHSGRLAFDRTETESFFAAVGLSLPPNALDQVWGRTEGWPVGVYLAARALVEDPDPVAAAERFSGGDRLVAGYLRRELLATLPHPVRDLLVGACVLDELSAAACDHVLERDDSARVLEDADRACPLLIPLDGRGDRYRMHQLLHDALRAELSSRDPHRERELLERAADWYAANGDLGRAIERVLAAGDHDRAQSLIWRGAPDLAGAGRTATVEHWFERFTRDELRGRAALAVTKAWCALTLGDMSSLRYWAEVVSSFPDGDLLPDGTPVAGAAALLRATVGAHGIEQVRADAALAFALHPPASPYRAIACYLEGLALRTLGRATEAQARLELGEAIGAQLLPATQALCLGQLAALAVDAGEWDVARCHADHYSGVVDRFELHERPAQGVACSVVALVHAHEGDTSEARTLAKHALFLVSMMATVAPLLSAVTRIVLVRTFQLLGEVGQAKVLAQEARELLVLVPDGDPLRAELEQLERSLDRAQVPLGVIATPMTSAELRVLRYLPTHLTIAAIADELFVSRNTVKTQVLAVYRKLGVSARGQAVEAARNLGLVEDEQPGRAVGPG